MIQKVLTPSVKNTTKGIGAFSDDIEQISVNNIWDPFGRIIIIMTGTEVF